MFYRRCYIHKRNILPWCNFILFSAWVTYYYVRIHSSSLNLFIFVTYIYKTESIQQIKYIKLNITAKKLCTKNTQRVCKKCLTRTLMFWDIFIRSDFIVDLMVLILPRFLVHYYSKAHFIEFVHRVKNNMCVLCN